MSFLIGGALIYLVGTAMVLFAAFGVSTLWGVLVLLVPPLQCVFALLHWNKAWDALLMQVFGLGMVLAFFAQGGGFDEYSMRQSLAQVQQQLSRQLQSPSSGGTVTVQGDQAAQEAPVIDTTPVEVTSEQTATAPTTVTATPSKAVDDKPIFKCTDPQGNETYSTQPCKGGVVKAKP